MEGDWEAEGCRGAGEAEGGGVRGAGEAEGGGGRQAEHRGLDAWLRLADQHVHLQRRHELVLLPHRPE